MIIKDLNSNNKNVSSLKQVDFDRKNDCVVYRDIERDGELVKVGEQQVVETTEKYIEANVIGRTGREWTEWYPMETFIKLNPEVKV